MNLNRCRMATGRVRAVLGADPRTPVGITILIPAYFLAILLLMPHSHLILGEYVNAGDNEFTRMLECQTIHNCPRYVSAAISSLISLVINNAYLIFASGSSEPTHGTGVPWDSLQPIIRNYLFRLVMLCPLVFLIAMTARRLGYSLFVLFVFMLISSGWGFFQPVLKSDLLRLIRPDQFHDFWEFGRLQILEPFDLFALSYLTILALVFVFCPLSPWRMAAFAALGQIGYEHLGFVTGVGAAIHVLLTGKGPIRSRFLPALRQLMICGLASVTVVVAIALLITFNSGQLPKLARIDVPISEDIFRFAWINIDNYRYILFRALYFLFFPATLGFVAGTFIGFFDRLDNSWVLRYRTLAAACLSILVGYFGALAIGFFTVITYSSEMARELYAFVILLFFFTLASGALLGSYFHERFFRNV